MTDPTDPRSRNVDPFEAPDDYADPTRGRRIPILVVGVAIIVLLAVLWLFFQ